MDMAETSLCLLLSNNVFCIPDAKHYVAAAAQLEL